jgi:hypothetical protein
MKQKKTKVQDTGPILKKIWSQTTAEYRVKNDGNGKNVKNVKSGSKF